MQDRNKDADENGLGLLGQREGLIRKQDTWQLASLWRSLWLCIGGGALIRGKQHEGVEYHEERTKQPRWEEGRQQNTPETQVLFVSFAFSRGSTSM